MAEILFWATAQQAVVPVAKMPFLWMPGDVIAVCPDGHGWGRKEVANEQWRIWQMPGVSPLEFGDLLEDDRSEIAGARFFVRMRLRYLDLTSIEARVLVGRGQVMKLDEADTRLVRTWRKTKQTLGTIG